MATLKICFWLCLFIVFYSYLGYGMLLWVLIKVRRLLKGKPVEPQLPSDDSQLPTMTLMICAYNEEAIIREKMDNIRQLLYPTDRLCVMWVTDGSTDHSNDLLAEYPEVKLVFSPERRGKAAALKHGLSENKAELVVFTDANTMLNADALREIARQFLKPGVSCVSGEKRVAARTSGEAAAEGEGIYWRYESTLKRWDSELYSAMGAAGELFAIRMAHYQEAPSNALLDDFMMSMLIVRNGQRIAYTPKAYATEYGSADMQEESKRKRRIAAGGLQSVWWLRGMMNPLRQPVVAFQFVSHRVLRWTIAPFALLALLPLNIALVAMRAGTLYTVVLVLQAIFYAAALAGWLMAINHKRQKLLYIPYYFMFMNANVFRGIGYLRTHKNSGVWEKARRS
jgi:cellulose synthase/poly-beta-1,6-N-acetylglucosamine synthase-like glycosyltransferase